MKLTYAALLLSLVSAPSFAGVLNTAAEKAYQAHEYAEYIHDLSESVGSAEQCSKLVNAWNQALVQGSQNYSKQPDKKDFDLASKMCINQYESLIDAIKHALNITH